MEEILVKPGKHTTGKGCVYIKKLTDVDLETLAALKKICGRNAREKFNG